MNFEYQSLVKQIERYFNTNEPAIADRVFHPRLVYYAPVSESAGDLAAFRRWICELHEAYDDLQFTFEDVILGHNAVAIHWVVTGVHSGPLGAVQPTGRSIHLEGAALLHVTVNQITRCWIYYDRLALFQQLGAAPHIDTRQAEPA